MNPELIDIYKSAWNHYRQHKNEESLSECNHILSFEPENPWVLCLVVRNILRIDGTLEAEKILTPIISKFPNFAPVKEIQGVILEGIGDINGAFKFYNEAIRLDPKFALAYNDRGSLYEEKGDRNAALKDYSEAIRQDPNLAIPYSNRANLLMELGNLDEAIRDVSEAIKLEPTDYLAYYNRGVMQGAKGNTKAAFLDYNEAIRINPEFANAYLNRGVFLMQQGDLAAAEKDFTDTIRLDPKLILGFKNRGLTYLDLGKIDAAINDLTYYLQQKPGDSIVITYLMRCYEKLGDIPKALAVAAQSYQTKEPQYIIKDNEAKFWFDSISMNFSQQIRPKLLRSKDRFVCYWPIFIRWGFQRRQSLVYEGNTNYVQEGNYGAGYLVLSEQNLYIINLGDVSKRNAKANSLIIKAISLMVRNFDFTRVEKTDRIFMIPHIDIQSASIKDNVIYLNSGNEAWEISPFEDQIQIVSTAINLARQGKISSLFDPAYLAQNNKRETPPAKEGDVFQAIEKLKKLVDIGAISQDEFETKKKELLTRI